MFPQRRMVAQPQGDCPEDIYGPIVTCSECDNEFYSGHTTQCDECGYDAEDLWEPPEPDDFIDDGPGGAFW